MTGYEIRTEKRLALGLPHNAKPKVKYVEIQRRIGSNHPENHDNWLDIRTINLRWDRRTEFDQKTQVGADLLMKHVELK